MCYQAQGNREGVLRGAHMMHTQADKVLAKDPSNGAALGICAGVMQSLAIRSARWRRSSTRC